MPGLMLPKPRLRALEKRDRASDQRRVDEAEKAKVRARSGGRCEVYLQAPPPWEPCIVRCPRPAMPGTHHLIYGIGRRNRGKSILAAHRIDVCRKCHDDIGRKILRPLGTKNEQEAAATVIYERLT